MKFVRKFRDFGSAFAYLSFFGQVFIGILIRFILKLEFSLLFTRNKAAEDPKMNFTCKMPTRSTSVSLKSINQSKNVIFNILSKANWILIFYTALLTPKCQWPEAFSTKTASWLTNFSIIKWTFFYSFQKTKKKKNCFVILLLS